MAFLFLFNVLPKNSLLPKLVLLTSTKRSKKVEKRLAAPKPIFWVGKKDDGVDLNRKVHRLRNSHLLWRPSWWQKGEPWKTRALPTQRLYQKTFFFPGFAQSPQKENTKQIENMSKKIEKGRNTSTGPKTDFFGKIPHPHWWWGFPEEVGVAGLEVIPGERKETIHEHGSATGSHRQLRFSRST